MANYSLWNIRLRHVWLSTPLKGKRVKGRARNRIGIQEAMDRKAPSVEKTETSEA